MRQFPSTQNRSDELMAQADSIARNVVEKNPHVVAVLLTGGLARGFADEFSDVDLEVFFHREHTWTWVSPMTNTYTPQGNFVEFEKRCLEAWMNPRNDENIWTMANRWDKSHARILYDPQGEVGQLLKKKLIFRPGELKTLRHEARGCEWLADSVADIWVQRGDLAAAHHSVNRGIDLLLDYLFLKNREFIPFEKWKLVCARQLPILPKDFERRIHHAMLIKELSEADLRGRQSVFLPLVNEAHHLPNKRT